jgi:molybdate transport system ATP-binding protein
LLEVDISCKKDGFVLEAALVLRGAATGIYGPSGSGKTTFLNLLAGLEKADTGKIIMNGKTVFDSQKGINLPSYKRHIGYVFQDNQLFPHLTVKKNLLYGYNLLTEEQRHFTPGHIIKLFDIASLLERYPENLSGGEKQRVALGRAILTSPQILLFDEPLSSLDEDLKSQIIPFFRKIIDEIRIPLIYVSHSINEILCLTDHLVILEKGKIIASGPFQQIIKKSNVFKLTKSSGFENIIRGKILKNNLSEEISLVEINHHKLNLPISKNNEGDNVIFSIRPQDIAIAVAPVQGISILNQVKGIIVDIKTIESYALIQIDIGINILSEISIKSLNSLVLKKGDIIYCLIKASSFKYLT